MPEAQKQYVTKRDYKAFANALFDYVQRFPQTHDVDDFLLKDRADVTPKAKASFMLCVETAVSKLGSEIDRYPEHVVRLDVLEQNIEEFLCQLWEPIEPEFLSDGGFSVESLDAAQNAAMARVKLDLQSIVENVGQFKEMNV